MKPATFTYERPASVAEALALLAEHGDEAKVLAGGQSLVPAMNFRLAQPGVLIDINRLSELDYVRESDEGGALEVGALCRQRAVETSALVGEHVPLLQSALPYIAHVQIRNRGTIGGSLAHADPAAELPAVALALGARLCVEQRGGNGGEGQRGNRRWIDAQSFFHGLMATSMADDELLVAISWPAAPARSGHGFVEFARRHGDYALVGVAAQVVVDDDGVCREARIALFGVGESAVLAAAANASLLGHKPSAEAVAAAADTASTSDIDPHSDLHASARFRRHLAKTLTARALSQAFAQAQASERA